MPTPSEVEDDPREFWRAWREANSDRRAMNRSNAPKLLHEAGVCFVTKNNGAHLIVRTAQGRLIDFWPGPGLWIVRETRRAHHGVRDLIAFCRPPQPEVAE